jgi:hypothetical protein
MAHLLPVSACPLGRQAPCGLRSRPSTSSFHIPFRLFLLLLTMILQVRTVSDDSKVKRPVTMNNPNDEPSKSTTPAAATAARPSTVPTRSKGGSTKRGKSKKTPATHAAAAGQMKEADAKNPAPCKASATKVQVKPPPPGGAAKGAAAGAVPPATAVVINDSVAATVRALLETDLVSETGATKVGALRALAGYFRPVKEGSPADKRWEPFRRAVVQANGCRKVLDVLHQELAKTGASGGGGNPGPNRDVVGAALRFLESWNAHSPEHRADASRHGGALAIVGAMRAFPYNSEIQRKALACIRNVAVEDAGAGPRLRALVEADAMLQVSRAMMAHPRDVELRTLSIRILGRLREHGGDRIYDLYKSEAGEYLSMLCFMYGESDDPEDEELEYILRELVLEMLE